MYYRGMVEMQPHELPNVFSRNLRAWRTRRNLSQMALAKEAHISHVSIVNWESGKNSPTLTSVVRIAEALRVNPEALLNDIDAASQAENSPPKILANAG